MCGIYGRLQVASGIQKSDAQLSISKLSHRGPDGSGVYLSNDSRLALGHSRLSVIDLTDSGSQPMLSGSNRNCITFNGEIYNFRSLRGELEALGIVFKGNSDTEVLLEAYEEWGPAMLDKLEGMFAFAIATISGRGVPISIFLARDRVGEKPLYYRFGGGYFEFGSDPSCFKEGLELDADGINCYLALGYSLPGTCIYSNVSQLEPANSLLVSADCRCVDPVRYWSVPEGWDGISRSLDELAEELEPLFLSAVSQRLYSDVPVAVFLSGGLDSSLIAAAAVRAHGDIKTLTVTFPKSGGFDESSYARDIANHFSTDHCEIDGREIYSLELDNLFKTFSDPIGDSSIIPTYLISTLTKQVATVAIGGDGGDELFAGYSAYAAAIRSQNRYRNIPNGVLALTGNLAAKLPVGFRGRAALASLRGGRNKTRVYYNSYFDPNIRRNLLGKWTLNNLKLDLHNPEIFRANYIDQQLNLVEGMTRMDFATYLPNDILHKVDRASMAASLEVRAPWLDSNILSFCFGKIPPYFKVNGVSTRLVQKALAKRLLPKNYNLERKQGFSLPVADLTKQMLVEDDRMELPSKYINGSEVRRLNKLAQSGKNNISSKLASLYFLSKTIDYLDEKG